MTPPARQLPDAAATEALGAALGQAMGEGVIYLEGELGAGKTTLARGLLQARGVDGPVGSPTYTLMEPYTTASGVVLHLDLYRLADPEELHFLGIEDVAEPRTLALIEWPGRGGSVLPGADLTVELIHAGGGRSARLTAHTEKGAGTLRCLGSGTA